MRRTPEDIAVHEDEGCDGERFNGPTGCYHSKETSVTDKALVPYQVSPPARTEFTAEEIKTIKDTICRGSTDSELGLFLATSRRTGLDPFMHQIWAIQRKINVGTREHPEWQKVITIQVGIDGYRLIAQRTGLYAGGDGPQWSADGKEWVDAWYLPGSPKFARYAAYRKDVERPFVAVCRWEAYVQDSPLWTKMGPEQLGKCSEALALRRAFPAEMSGVQAIIEEGNDYVTGQVIDAAQEVPPEAEEEAETAALLEPPPAPPERPVGASTPTPTIDTARFGVLVDYLNDLPTEDRIAALAAVEADFPYIMQDGRRNLLLLTPEDGEDVIIALKNRADIGATRAKTSSRQTEKML